MNINRIMFCLILMISTFLITGCEVEDEIGIDIAGEDSVTLEVSDVYNEQGATCISKKADCYIVIDSSEIDNGVTGSYNVVYKAIVDSEVVSEVIRKVEVVDSKDPVITTTFFESDSTIKLVASDAYYFDNFGSSVDKYGNYVVVGANSDDDNGGYSGSAYLYKLNDKTFEIKITPTDGKEVGLFGNSVSIDGDYIIVGAPGKVEQTEDGQKYNSGPGSVYVYKISDPSYERKIVASDGRDFDHFGIEVDMYGNYIVVASLCTEADYSICTDENNNKYNKAYVYKLDDLQYERIIITENISGFRSLDVAIDDNYIVLATVYSNYDVGFLGEVPLIGSVHLYKIDDLTYERTIVPAFSEVEDEINGWSVSLDENNLVVSSEIGIDTSVYIYDLNDDTFERKISNLEPTTYSRPMTAISVGGDIVVSGIHVDNPNGLFAYVHKLSDDSFEKRILVNAGNKLDAFGYAVIADDDFILIAAKGDDNE